MVVVFKLRPSKDHVWPYIYPTGCTWKLKQLFEIKGCSVSLCKSKDCDLIWNPCEILAILTEIYKKPKFHLVLVSTVFFNFILFSFSAQFESNAALFWSVWRIDVLPLSVCTQFYLYFIENNNVHHHHHYYWFVLLKSHIKGSSPEGRRRSLS